MSRQQEIHALLAAEQIDLERLTKLFEEAAPAERVAITESVSGAQQARLWEATEGRSVHIHEMVPRETGPLVPVTFHGKNSLAAFNRFQKRFCRPSEGVDRDELWGFNYQPTRWLAPLTGPGYFVACDSSDPLGSVAIDYRKLPGAHPPDWPEIRDNRQRLSRFIFYGMIDYLRRISEHLLIGRASRGGKPLPNYFLLCREDP